VPTPAKTSDARVVAAARGLVEQRGAAAISMQDVAAAVSVRAPSLYKRFPTRAALLAAVAVEVLAKLRGTLVEAADYAGRDGWDRLWAIAAAYRRFAHAHPHAYALLFAPDAPRGQEASAARADAAEPLLAELRGMLAEADVLPATRVVTAFLHGFVAMELAGAFRLGGDPEVAFARGLDAVLPRRVAHPRPSAAEPVPLRQTDDAVEKP